MNDDISYYDVLGVSHTASQQEITRAYRELAKKVHPDVGGSAHAMRLLNRAYKTLSNKPLRDEYDASFKKETQNQFYEEHTYHAPTAQDLIAEEKTVVASIKKASWINMFKGGGIGLAGIVITSIGYSATSPGGHYVVFWGLIIWGVVVFFGAWYNLLNPYASLHRALDKPHQKYEFYLEKTGAKARALGIIIGCCVLITILLGTLGSASSNNESASSTNTSTAPSQSTKSSYLKAKLDEYNSCKDQYNQIHSELTGMESQMESYKSNGYIESYNMLVPQQNSLVEQQNSKYAECEQLRQDYNSSI